jgi:hypothetical protein
MFHSCMLYDILQRVHHCNKGPLIHHIVSRYNSAVILINFSLILHCIACFSQIHPFIIIIHIFKYLCTDPFCFPQSVQYIFIGLAALIFPAKLNSQFFYCDFHLSFSTSSHIFSFVPEIVFVYSSLFPL